jgi:hypothetical protein
VSSAEERARFSTKCAGPVTKVHGTSQSLIGRSHDARI